MPVPRHRSDLRKYLAGVPETCNGLNHRTMRQGLCLTYQVEPRQSWQLDKLPFRLRSQEKCHSGYMGSWLNDLTCEVSDTSSDSIFFCDLFLFLEEARIFACLLNLVIAWYCRL